MKFLHNRMPVILNPGSAALRCWLDPQRNEWSRDLQCLLKPFPEALDIYPVTKEVGKVGNDSPSFITPRDSQDNKSNIANYFSSTSKSHEGGMKRCGDHNANTTFTLKRKSEEEAEWPMKKGRPNNVKKEKKEVDAQKITDFFLKPQ